MRRIATTVNLQITCAETASENRWPKVTIDSAMNAKKTGPMAAGGVEHDKGILPKVVLQLLKQEATEETEIAKGLSPFIPFLAAS